MLKTKKTLLLILVALLLILIPNMVNAVETFTTDDGIVATKIIENTDGTIDFKLTNIALSAEGQYTWGVGTTASADDVEKWYTLGDFSEANKSAILSLTPSISSIKSILRTTNTAWLYVKDVANNKYIVDALKVDLTLPALKAFAITKSTWYDPDVPGNPAWEISSTYGIKNHYYKMEKITDTTIINQFEKNNGDLNKVKLAELSQAPETGWISCLWYNEVHNSAIPKDQGLYYLWVKAKDTDSKTIIGYTVINFDAEGPIVERISVNSPASGTYKTGQTVKIRVYFNETITGTKVPTLKVRFGDSAERSLTNGTISGSYIEYSYDIQESDKGQLATVSLSGGTIKDANGNDAKLSCPIITGNTIKANVEGTTTNNTENQDVTNNQNNNETNNNEETNNQDNNIENNNQESDNKTDKKEETSNKKEDKTTAPGEIPYAGGTFAIVLSIVAIVGIGIYVYKRNNDLKGI